MVHYIILFIRHSHIYTNMYRKDLYQVQQALKRLCEFSTVWADRADLGSQKVFSKLTTSSSRKTYDINYPNQKKFGSLIFKPKKQCWFQPMIKKNLRIGIIKHVLLINKKILLNILDTFHKKIMKRKLKITRHTQLNVCEKEELSCT